MKINLILIFFFFSNYLIAQVVNFQVSGGAKTQKYFFSEQNTIWDDSSYFAGGIISFGLGYSKKNNSILLLYSFSENAYPTLLKDRLKHGSGHSNGSYNEFTLEMRSTLFPFWSDFKVSALWGYSFKYTKLGLGRYYGGMLDSNLETIYFDYNETYSKKQYSLLKVGAELSYTINNSFSLFFAYSYNFGFDIVNRIDLTYYSDAEPEKKNLTLSSDGRYSSFVFGCKYALYSKKRIEDKYNNHLQGRN